MNELTIFALTLLAVPVFARFARVPAGSRKIYHMIGLGGLLFLLGEATRIVAMKIAIFGMIEPILGYVTGVLAFASVAVGTVWVTIYYLRHFTEET